MQEEEQEGWVVSVTGWLAVAVVTVSDNKTHAEIAPIIRNRCSVPSYLLQFLNFDIVTLGEYLFILLTSG